MGYEELKVKLEEWLEELEDQEKATRTLKKYKVNVNGFIEFMKDKEWSKKSYREFVQKLEDINQYLPNTSNSYIIAINKFLKWLGYSSMTVKQLKLQRDSSINEYMSLADYKRLLRWAKQLNRMDDYYIIKILAKTGIRISELKYFTIENLNTEIIVRNKGKIRKGMIV